ncbi:MAG TPA: GNAT family N-acetyltransferase [Pyrinomonadaceae bacterium]|jgi:GNAT superfamily N-acetyltransferase|nr:GNAT family N-acetyltransferase [Pyrinomonadaceae bacterium]
MEIVEEPIAVAPELARIPISFEVESVFDVTALGGGLGGLILSERRLDTPYVKDYDTAEGEHPSLWAGRFDVSNWGFVGAHSNGARVGGAVVAFNTQGVSMLEGRRDLAVLWDIRVSPEARGQGVGFALFRAAGTWAAARGCRQLKIETQNINVPACRFYARQDCVLGAINRFAYREFPDEVQLLWYKSLPPPAG